MRTLLIILLSAVAVVNVACSTQMSPGYVDHSSVNSAYDAYVACVQELAPTGQAAICDRVQPRSNSSYLNRADYLYGSSDYGWDRGDYGRNQYREPVYYSKSFKSVNVEGAWINYLSSMDPSALDDMTRQWQELSDR